MLSLRYTEVLPRQSDGKIRLRDSTGAYDAAANAGGYGGPNPGRLDVSVYVLLSMLLPGQMAYGATTAPESYDPATGTSDGEPTGVLRITGDQDGVLQVLALAIEHGAASATEAGSLYVDLDGTVKKRMTSSSSLALEIDPVEEGFTGLRQNQPAAVALSEFGLTLLLDRHVHDISAQLLLNYARGGNRSQPLLRTNWVNNTIMLASVQELYAAGRFGECSAVLRQLSMSQHNGYFYSDAIGTAVPRS